MNYKSFTKFLSRCSPPIVAALVLLTVGLALAGGPCYRLCGRLYTAHFGEKHWNELATSKHPRNPDDPVARLLIRDVNLAHNVLMGTSEENLDQLPAIDEQFSNDNRLVILGHRDTHFNKLKHLKIGATVELRRLDRINFYEVDDIEIHTPQSLQDRIETLNDPNTVLLVSCYPFHYFGPAPKRFLAICKGLDEG